MFIHSQINIIKALALAWLVAPMQFMGLMKINVGQKPHITAIFMGLNQNCHTKLNMKKTSIYQKQDEEDILTLALSLVQKH